MINFEYNGKKYSLGFNRKTAAHLQRSGYDNDELAKKPLIMVPLLVHGAFMMNHPKVKGDTIDSIYEALDDKTEFVVALSKNYLEACNTLFDTEDDEAEGKENLVKWEAL